MAQQWKRPVAGAAVFGVAAVLTFSGMNLVRNAQFAQAQQEVESTRQQLAQVEDLATVFREVSKVVEPSVVSLQVTKKNGAGLTMRGGGMPFDDEMLRRFFPDRNGDGEPDVPEGFGEGPTQQGNGSGVIMDVTDGTGFVVTNNHVVEDADEIVAILSDGRRVTGVELIGRDPKTDVAVVKLTADRLIPAKWGNSDELQKGDWILAFGSPFGYVGSMTHGIVSALNRDNVGILGSMGYENFIQVDAPINPGNSGGPLVNVRGEVVGINTAIASRTGGSMGIGFAIPSNQAKMIYSTLREKGQVVRGFLGVSIADVANLQGDQRAETLLRSTGYEGAEGVLVIQTSSNTPAAGKLEPGDVVLSYDGKKINDVQQLRNLVAATAPGTTVTLGIVRNGQEQNVQIEIGNQPENLEVARATGPGFGRGDANTIEKLGLRLGTLNDELAERFNLSGVAEEGAVVVSVAPNSPAFRQGLRAGDVITRIGREPIESADEASELLKKADLAEGVTLHVANSEGSRLVPLQTDE